MSTKLRSTTNIEKTEKLSYTKSRHLAAIAQGLINLIILLTTLAHSNLSLVEICVKKAVKNENKIFNLKHVRQI